MSVYSSTKACFIAVRSTRRREGTSSCASVIFLMALGKWEGSLASCRQQPQCLCVRGVCVCGWVYRADDVGCCCCWLWCCWCCWCCWGGLLLLLLLPLLLLLFLCSTHTDPHTHAHTNMPRACVCVDSHTSVYLFPRPLHLRRPVARCPLCCCCCCCRWWCRPAADHGPP